MRIILSACLALVCLGVVRPGPTRAAASAGFNAGRAFDDVAYLSEVVGPRPKGSEGQRRASDFVARQFEQAGLTVERQVFTAESSGMLYSGSNIVGDLPRSGDVILICAHLDTVPVSPGANDNASGVAAMLELARVTRARTYPFGLRFVAFDGEEPNRDGSAYYVGELSAEQRAAISLVLNLDMVGAGGPLQVSGTRTALGDRTEQLAAVLGIDAMPAAEPPSGDFRKFERAGLPALTFIRDDRRFHTPRDRPEFVLPEYLGAIGDLILAILDDYGTGGETPWRASAAQSQVTL